MEEQILGDYRVIKQIGEGVFGPVFLTEHRFIKKPFVLKRLPKELSKDPSFLERFEEEIGKVAALEHDHILKVHNVSFAEGHYFLVSEFIEDSIGEMTNLAQYMAGRKERLREDELISLLKQIASAFDYAHERGIAHGSFKLNAVLIGKGKPGIEVAVSDFGLAKIIHPVAVVGKTFEVMASAMASIAVDETSDEQGPYYPQVIASRPHSQLSESFLQFYPFLSPEQKQMEPLSFAMDTYAFGVLTYYLIAGVFPEGVFQPPSQLAPDYEHNWDYVVSECLRFEPQRRPRSLTSLLNHEQSPLIKVPILKTIGNEKREAPEPLKTIKASMQSTVKAAQPELVGAISSLKPVIQRSAEISAPKTEPLVSVVVEKKDLSEATPLPQNPPEDKKYTEALSSMLKREPQVTQYSPEKQEHRHIEPLQTEMRVIQGGNFQRGSNQGRRDEMPNHRIFQDSFAIDVHPVTNEQFVRFLEHMGCEKDKNYYDLIRLKDSRINRIGGRLSVESGYAKHPVVGVTWYGSSTYAHWVGKRLPSEVEWEIAARGGLESCDYPTGDNIEKHQANFFNSDTTAVTSYAANGYGVYDMTGNVYEWCQDWYDYGYYEISAQEPNNPKGPPQGVYRVLRGGCWKSLKDDMRFSHRHRNNPGTVNSTYGFRCAADVQ